MLTLSDIRDTASSRIYRKGLELQSYKLVKNFEYSIFVEPEHPHWKETNKRTTPASHGHDALSHIANPAVDM